MIEIKNLTKTFGEVKAVDDLSINIYPGINGLVGENGAGKSTLLRLISDVYQSDDGTILIDEKENHEVDAKKEIFFLSDNPYVPSNSSVKQTYEFYSTLFSLNENRFVEIMNKLSLPLNRKVSTFSKGMKRQFFLALSLSANCKYILLDEAFDGLDPLVLETIKQEIIKDADEKTYIVSSHNISSLERLCDNFILLSKGRCKKTGNIEHLGENFTKYQIFAKENITEEILVALEYRVLSFKKVGSINNVVFYDDVDLTKLKKKFDIVLAEKIPIDPDEIIALEMLSAKKEN